MRVLDLRQLGWCRSGGRIEDHRGPEGYRFAYHFEREISGEQQSKDIAATVAYLSELLTKGEA